MHVERVSGVLKLITIQCDSCKITLTDQEIIALGGLKKLGWKTGDHNKHICESCKWPE